MTTYRSTSDGRVWNADNAEALIDQIGGLQGNANANERMAFMRRWPEQQARRIPTERPKEWLEYLIRHRFITELRPIDAAPVLDEWKECRATIGRFDGLLVDLRKTGFSFVTAIASGATFFFAVDKSSQVPESGKFAVFTIIMVLTLTLYVVDRVHQIMQQEAVDLACRLEASLDLTITGLLGSNYTRSYAIGLGVGLYWVLLIAVYLASLFTSNGWSGYQLAMLLELVIGLAVIEFVVLKTRLW